MPFAAVGTALGATAATATMTGVAATAGVVGLGMSAASAAGAFGGSPQKYMPTKEEKSAADAANRMYNLGQKISKPVNAEARKNLDWLHSNEALDLGAGDAINQSWQGVQPNMQRGLTDTAIRTGGPGSGAWMNQLNSGATGVNNMVRGAGVKGRLGVLNDYTNKTGAFLGNRLNLARSGLNAMVTGGQQSSQLESARIQAQMQDKIAANHAMGQIGGSLMSMGTGLAGMGAGAVGASAVDNSPWLNSMFGGGSPVGNGVMTYPYPG